MTKSSRYLIFQKPLYKTIYCRGRQGSIGLVMGRLSLLAYGVFPSLEFTSGKIKPFEKPIPDALQWLDDAYFNLFSQPMSLDEPQSNRSPQANNEATVPPVFPLMTRTTNFALLGVDAVLNGSFPQNQLATCTSFHHNEPLSSPLHSSRACVKND